MQQQTPADIIPIQAHLLQQVNFIFYILNLANLQLFL